jgi:hypothetical protein
MDIDRHPMDDLSRTPGRDAGDYLHGETDPLLDKRALMREMAGGPMWAAPRRHTDPTDYRGQSVYAEAVRYVQDFESTRAADKEWEGLRVGAFDALSSIAGPFGAGGASVRVETTPGELYMVRFDLALVGARIGSPEASDTFLLEVDGAPIIERPIREYTAIASDLRTDMSDPLVVPKILLFFEASHRITTIAFRAERAGGPGGEVWGFDNVVIDRAPNNPGAYAGGPDAVIPSDGR